MGLRVGASVRIGLMLLVVGMGGAAASQELVRPFDPARVTRDNSLLAKRFNGCPRPPSDLLNRRRAGETVPLASAPSFRGTGMSGVAAERPLRAYARQLTAMADAYLMSPQPNPLHARCVAQWLDAWAGRRLLLGDMPSWLRQSRIWFAQIQFGMAYLKVRDEPSIPRAQHEAIRGWLVAMARDAIADRERAAGGDVPDHLSAWTAAAAAVAAIAAQDRPLFDSAIARARTVLATVDRNGALPRELKEGARAAQFHVWLLEPLAFTALLAERNEVALAAENDKALRRLVDFVIAAQRDRSVMQRLAGAVQTTNLETWPNAWEQAALELIHAVEPHATLASILASKRPVSSQMTGGDWTRTLGQPVP
jgi:Alginate lyase